MGSVSESVSCSVSNSVSCSVTNSVVNSVTSENINCSVAGSGDISKSKHYFNKFKLWNAGGGSTTIHHNLNPTNQNPKLLNRPESPCSVNSQLTNGSNTNSTNSKSSKK